MADNFESSLGFNADDALKTLKLLDAGFSRFTQAIEANIAAAQQFNSNQSGMESILFSISKAASQTVKDLLSLADAESKAAAAAKKNKDLANLSATLDARRKAIDISKQVTNQLNVNRTNAPVAKLASFDGAIANFQKLVQTTSASSSQIQRILANLSGAYVGADRKIRDALVDIIQKQAQLGGGNADTATRLLKTMGVEGGIAGDKITSGLTKATTASNGLFLSWQSVTRIFVGQTIFRAISALTSELEASVQRARDLELVLAQIRTIAPKDLQIGGLDQIGALTKNLSNTFGVDQVEAAKATYEAFSSQIGSTAETMQFLNETSKLAITTMSKQDSAAAVAASILNGYGLSAEHAAEVSDLLFTTIDISAAKMDDFAGNVGRVVPTSKQLGVSLKELFAAFSTLSIQGTDSSTAFTQLLNVMKGLIKPSDALKTRFKELGVASAEVGVAQFGGLFNFVQAIAKNQSGLAALGELFDDVRELQGVLGVLNNDSVTFNRSLEAMAKNAGSAGKAFKIVNETGAQQLNRSIQEFKNTLTEDIGGDVVKAINAVVEAFGGAENAAKSIVTLLEGSIPAISLLIGGQLVKSLGTATSSMISFASAGKLAIGPLAGIATFAGFAVIIGGLTLLASELDDIYDRAGKLQKRFSDTTAALAEFNARDLQGNKKVNDAINAQTDTTTQSILTSLAKRTAGMASLEAEIERMEDAITKNLREQVNAREKLIDQFLNKADDSAVKAGEKISKIADNLKDFELKFSSDKFDRNIKASGDDIAKQSSLLNTRIAEFRKLSAKANKSGKFDDATDFNNEAVARAKQLAELPKQRAAGESLLNSLLKERQNIAKTETASIQTQVAALAKVRPELDAQATKVKELKSQYDALSKALDKTEPNSEARASVQKNLEGVGKALQDALIQFSDKIPAGVADDLKKSIKEQFTTIGGEKVNLDFLTADSLAQVQSQLDKRRFTAELELKISQITGLTPGADLSKDLSTQVQKLNTLSKQNRDKSAGVGGTQRNIENAKQEITDSFESIKKQTDLLKKGFAGGSLTSLATIVGESLFGDAGSGLLGTGPGNFTEKRKQAADNISSQLEQFQKEVNDSVKNLDFDAIGKAQDKIANFTTANKGNQSLDQILKQLGSLNSALQQFVDNSQKATSQEAAAEAASAQEETLKQLELILPQAQQNTDAVNKQDQALKDAAPAAESGIGTAVSLLDQFIGTAQQATQAQLALNAAMAAGGGSGGQTQNAARGGLIHYKAGGGFIPKGTDTVPAMLSPGEFVVNAAMTRRFYSELVSINSGKQPIYREQGGVVNNSFGDLHINLPSGSSETHARTVMRKIQRELRRGSTKLR